MFCKNMRQTNKQQNTNIPKMYIGTCEEKRDKITAEKSEERERERGIVEKI